MKLLYHNYKVAGIIRFLHHDRDIDPPLFHILDHFQDVIRGRAFFVCKKIAHQLKFSCDTNEKQSINM